MHTVTKTVSHNSEKSLLRLIAKIEAETLNSKMGGIA